GPGGRRALSRRPGRRGGLDRLPAVDAARRHLPVDAPGDVPVLADQHHGLAIEEGEDPHALPTADDSVERGAPVRHLHLVLVEADPRVPVGPPRRQGPPGHLREPAATPPLLTHTDTSIGMIAHGSAARERRGQARPRTTGPNSATRTQPGIRQTGSAKTR